MADHDELVEALLRESEEMEADFTGWLEREAPRWRALGRDETWIRLRIESAQAMRNLNRLMQKHGLSEAQRRDALRAGFADLPTPPDPATIAPPETVEHALVVIGVEIGALIGELSPLLTRNEFLARVDFTLGEEFGEQFLDTSSARSRFVHDQLIENALREYARTGGVIHEDHPHGKLKRRKPHKR